MQQKDCRISRQSRLALCMVINVPKTCPYEHPAKNAEISQLCVGGDAYIAPANRTDFSGIFGEFDTSQWVDVGIDPYGENGRLIKIYKPAIWMMPLHKSATMQQAVMTPAPMESMAWESRLPSSAATSAPVHAPVPGRGMATKR